MDNITIKQISSLEKIRSYDDVPDATINKKCLLGGESFSYQIVVAIQLDFMNLKVDVESPLKEYVKVYNVEDVMMDLPIRPPCKDPDYIATEPGMMPDALIPIEQYNGWLRIYTTPHTLWVEVNIPRDLKQGIYPVDIKFTRKEPDGDTAVITKRMKLEVLGVNLPEQQTIICQWFHVDCIADVHCVDIYCEEHWALIEKYMKVAAELGINMLLTPVITPALNTNPGMYRSCTQLVKIEKIDDKYYFDFTLLKRWITLCKKTGIKYYEISYLFSQWGLKYSPNIRVKENGKEGYMFGWHVPARDDSYRDFLQQFLPALVDFLRTENVFSQSYFHLSDEPFLEHLENYRYAYDLVSPLLEGRPIMDAMSNVEFYTEGIVNVPITATNHLTPFLEKNVEEQWAYYCIAQENQVSNRFMSMPSYRNRIIGLQLYKYGIKGFLQWGYNFYYDSQSTFIVNPYLTSSSGKAYNSGDSFIVYPYMNEVIPSLRGIVFKEAIQEIELCRLLESYIGKEKVVELIEQEAGMELTMFDYPRNSEYLPSLNDKMKEIIRSHIGNSAFESSLVDVVPFDV